MSAGTDRTAETAELFAAAVGRHQTGALDGAVAGYRAVLALNPDHPNALSNLGVALKALDRLDDAVEAFRRCLAIRPLSAPVHYNLGNALVALRRLAEAEVAYREAVRIAPNYADAYISLGGMLCDIGRSEEAIAVYGKALELKPDSSMVHFNLGSLLQKAGALETVKSHYRRAIDTGPPPPAAFSNILFGQQSLPNYTQVERLADALAFGAMVRGRVKARYTAWNCDPEPSRLRVGLVSGDFLDHAAGYFIEGVVRAIDPARIDLVAYSNRGRESALTHRIKPCFSAWRTIDNISDEAVAALIHADAPHILIDLSGHTAFNRLGVFAWKPAPVQATWIGYFATTGLEEIDYYLADPHLLPPEDEWHFVERPWRLPSAGCLTEPAVPVEPNPPPFLTEGVFTFGCFNAPRKISDEVIALWSRILRLAPDSRLLLKGLGDPIKQGSMRRRFAVHGVGSDRLLFEGRSARDDYFGSYHRVDVALDPFPYPGATTSIEGLWMGVPVITRRGDRFLSRVGESIAQRAGLADWIAEDDDDYVAKAVALVADPTPLIALRAGLRAKVLASSLYDVEGFARNFEEALWGMWAEAEPGSA